MYMYIKRERERTSPTVMATYFNGHASPAYTLHTQSNSTLRSGSPSGTDGCNSCLLNNRPAITLQQ